MNEGIQMIIRLVAGHENHWSQFQDSYIHTSFTLYKDIYDLVALKARGSIFQSGAEQDPEVKGGRITPTIGSKRNATK